MSPKIKRILTTSIKILLAVAIFIFIFCKLNVKVSEMATAVKDPWWIVAAVFLVLVVNTFVSNNRWKSFLSMIGVNESFLRLVSINWKSSFIGTVLPSSQGYDVLRVYQIEKLHPEARGKVGGTVIVERIMGLICLTVIATVSWFFIASKSFIWPIIILLSLVLIVLFLIRNKWCYIHICNLLDNVKFLPRTSRYFKQLYEGLHVFPFTKKLILSIFLIFLLQLSNISIVYCLFRACGENINMLYHLCYQPIISVLTVIPITFGGIGVREGGFAYFYSMLEVDGAVIITVSLLYYIVLKCPSIIGGILYAIDSIKKKK